MIRRNIGVYYLLIIEVIFGGLIISFSYSLQGKEVPLQAYFLIMLTSSFAFVFLLDKFKEKGKWLFFLFIFPTLLFVGYLVASPVFVTILISFLIFWRTLANFYEQEKLNEGKWLVATILVGILVLFFTRSMPGTVISLMIGQIIFIFVGRFVKHLLEVDSLVNEKRRFINSFIIVVLFIGIAGLLFTAGMSTFKWLFFFILKMIVTVIVFISKPLFDWAETQDWTLQIEMLLNNQVIEEDGDPSLLIEKTDSVLPIDPSVIITILLIASIAVLFIYVYKRKKSTIKFLSIKKEQGFSSESSYLIETPSLFRLRKNTPPSDQIRFEIFNFERFARKYQFGREPFESLSDWMERIGLKNYEMINSIYEKVRYGDGVYTDKEAKDFKNDLEIKKQELKSMYKK